MDGAVSMKRPILVSTWPNRVVVHGIESSRQWMCWRSKNPAEIDLVQDAAGAGRAAVTARRCIGPPDGRCVATGAKLRGDPALMRRERPSAERAAALGCGAMSRALGVIYLPPWAARKRWRADDGTDGLLGNPGSSSSQSCRCWLGLAWHACQTAILFPFVGAVPLAAPPRPGPA